MKWKKRSDGWRCASWRGVRLFVRHDGDRPRTWAVVVEDRLFRTFEAQTQTRKRAKRLAVRAARWLYRLRSEDA